MLANSLHMLHFKSFLEVNGPVSAEFLEEIQKLPENPSSLAIAIFEEYFSYNDFMNKYDKFTLDTQTGSQGATAQYWMNYIDLVELYLLFSRATLTNDLDLFMYCHGEMVDILFALNHSN